MNLFVKTLFTFIAGTFIFATNARAVEFGEDARRSANVVYVEHRLIGSTETHLVVLTYYVRYIDGEVVDAVIEEIPRAGTESDSSNDSEESSDENSEDNAEDDSSAENASSGGSSSGYYGEYIVIEVSGDQKRGVVVIEDLPSDPE